MRFLVWLATTAIALTVAAWLIDGISFGPSAGSFTDDVADKWLTVVIVALILGAVSAIVKPLVKLLSLPVIILTVGLFLLVINALMLMLTGWIAGELDVSFSVDGFWSALFGSIIITLVTWLLDNLIKDKKDA
ncbi:phage holin family protein [Nocardioides limicola]|uniref:phage holin family protein n=1 Tax=Nocardioides limicola TaxID=2803368 RepID=UPI00193C26C3|nr:phage holin family protein [Nocardioides sp. DJM-14]